ncbi:MAG: IgGFc-binding protein [Lewinellaceae bacterium]|nr:IgGFc-binding protein [Lewinellaceae bacterium]
MQVYLRLSALLICSLFQTSALHAQLDTVHWIPPVYARGQVGPQYIYLSTPEKQPFPVTIRDGAGKSFKTVQLSRDQPFEYYLEDTHSQLIVADIQVHTVLADHGLVISGAKPFYAVFRAHSKSGADANQITCKGRAALGRTFRIAHLKQLFDKTGGRSNCVGVMATEDNTLVTFSEFDTTTLFKIGFAEKKVQAPVQVVLQKGETIVFAQHVHFRDSDQPTNGFMGALLEATKPVAVNCGSWMGAPVVYEINDIGMDQILPLERIGKEYVLLRGNGPTSLEHPIIVAHYDNTQVWLNGDTTPIAVLNRGEYLLVSAFYYFGTDAIFIRASEPVFVYQMIGGLSTSNLQLGTASLMFVPPINCGIRHAVGPLSLPTCIGTTCFEGGISILALRTATVSLLVDGQPKPVGAPEAIRGNPDFVVYRLPKLFYYNYPPDSVWLESDGPLQVTLLGRLKGASYAALYSDFEPRKPEVHIKHLGDGICPDTLVASGYFDGIEWIYSDSIFQLGPDTTFVVSAPGTYVAAAYIGECYNTSLVYDTIQVPLNAPVFPYSVQDASCFGVADGEIEIGTPNGGFRHTSTPLTLGKPFRPCRFFQTLAQGGTNW